MKSEKQIQVTIRMLEKKIEWDEHRLIRADNVIQLIHIWQKLDTSREVLKHLKEVLSTDSSNDAK